MLMGDNATDPPPSSTTEEAPAAPSENQKNDETGPATTPLETADTDLAPKESKRGSEKKAKDADASGKAPAKQGGGSPYVNPNRVLTGGLDKKRLAGDELEKRMEEMKRKNAEILRKKQAIEDDEKEWNLRDAEARKKAAAEEEARRREALAAKQKEEEKRSEKRKQEYEIKKEREENAARKGRAMAGREWDQDKPERGGRPASFSDKPRRDDMRRYEPHRDRDRNESTRDYPPRRQESSRDQPTRDQPTRGEPPRRYESGRDQPTRDDPPRRHESNRDQPNRDEPPRRYESNRDRYDSNRVRDGRNRSPGWGEDRKWIGERRGKDEWGYRESTWEKGGRQGPQPDRRGPHSEQRNADGWGGPARQGQEAATSAEGRYAPSGSYRESAARGRSVVVVPSKTTDAGVAEVAGAAEVVEEGELAGWVDSSGWDQPDVPQWKNNTTANPPSGSTNKAKPEDAEDGWDGPAPSGPKGGWADEPSSAHGWNATTDGSWGDSV
ncbi:hypothetical protein BDK51DRAFT_30066 [Blyttiomyces helicus]|uniref:Uncharacterized protein n=1 Tax=Blyttiomyces helicus TaxID=388810 RepID=A0A4P9WKS9_9FUNG|nr:hypothetical protein BDK51DRAFT_30066 [Blyttiomyces helicus]|eukprot:RKO93002.1 hypothetical protein BDK51DRAFT_30066 [Blyttiomyces helicus]